MSSRGVLPFLTGRMLFSAWLAAGLLAAAPAVAQYPGQVSKNSKQEPELRSVAVLEWTGEPGKPKKCRIVPVAVFDGEQFQDGGIYLARPEPIALAGEVEYQLETTGKPIGLFDIENSGREQGNWVGYGKWKPLEVEKPKPKPNMDQPAIEDEGSDRPTLHRKKKGSDSKSDGKSGSGAGTAPADPDRPTLHKKDTPDTDKTGSSAPGAASAPADPDQPVLKKNKKKPEDTSHVDSLPQVTDPDRPRLRRGKSEGSGLSIVPSLMGMPTDMQQTVAISDSRTRPEHPFAYSWADPADEGKMKSGLEDIARAALGLTAPPAAAPAPKRVAARKAVKPADPPAPTPQLTDENFRVFELSYGSGATMVLTAHTDGPPAQQKFVTLVAQPDLYGNILVLLKNVTDGAHLDDTPLMRLVDAVDAKADNRAELLFELRGQQERQFALYRILRGSAEKLFVSGGGE